ncbi:hypothetical protein AB4Y95_00275 [Arthrobacter sp. M-10]|uniref:hypothetical protein n=1 Tax=Arthrobacter sp. M-10 TaxID=3233037 RepID=UPI003F90AC4C
MAGFMRDIAGNIVGGFAVVGLTALAGATVAWWPNFGLRPWILSCMFVLLYIIVTGLRIYFYSRRHESDTSADQWIPYYLVMASIMSWLTGLVAGAILVYKNSQNAYSFAWILTGGITLFVILRITYDIEKFRAYRNPRYRIKYSASLPGFVTSTVVLRIFTGAVPLVGIWIGAHYLDVSQLLLR